MAAATRAHDLPQGQWARVYEISSAGGLEFIELLESVAFYDVCGSRKYSMDITTTSRPI
jgi:hypothetical protein